MLWNIRVLKHKRWFMFEISEVGSSNPSPPQLSCKGTDDNPRTVGASNSKHPQMRYVLS